MLAEIAEYLFTPCPPLTRGLGYLKESIAISARARRCRAAWRAHLENCRAVVLEAARACPGRGTALILGSGALLDIPVEELAAMFGQVVLADLIHPLGARRRIRELGNVRMDTTDVTGALEEVASGRMPEPVPPAPYPDLAPDLVVSANILSQLPLLPVARLEARGAFRPAALDAFARRLREEHLSWLARFPGVTCLITDTAWSDGDQAGNLLPGIGLPAPDRAWTWTIAPRPEIHPDRDVTHAVSAFLRFPRPRSLPSGKFSDYFPT